MVLIDGGPEGFQWFSGENKKNENMKEEITAEWARKTAQAILGEKVSKQIETCLNAIESAVKKNEMSCTVGIYADKLTIQELNKRGFTVKSHDDQRDGSYIDISW
jgi:hypothetical protein